MVKALNCWRIGVRFIFIMGSRDRNVSSDCTHPRLETLADMDGARTRKGARASVAFAWMLSPSAGLPVMEQDMHPATHECRSRVGVPPLWVELHRSKRSKENGSITQVNSSVSWRTLAACPHLVCRLRELFRFKKHSFSYYGTHLSPFYNGFPPGFPPDLQFGESAVSEGQTSGSGWICR